MRTTYCLILIALGIAGCDLSGNGDTIISSVQPGLQIDLVNPLETDSRFGIQLTAVGEYCEDAKLLVSAQQLNERISIDASDIEESQDCDPVNDNLYATVHLDPARVTYDLTVTVGYVLRNVGTLSYDGTKYTLEFNELNGLETGVTNLYEIPQNIIWGTVSSPGESAQLLEEFMMQAESVAKTPDLTAGNYGHFTLGADQEVNINNSDTEVVANYVYVLQLTTGVEDFKSFLDSFRNQQSEGASLTCLTWDGREL